MKIYFINLFNFLQIVVKFWKSKEGRFCIIYFKQIF